jgi:hypothetical protein
MKDSDAPDSDCTNKYNDSKSELFKDMNVLGYEPTPTPSDSDTK